VRRNHHAMADCHRWGHSYAGYAAPRFSRRETSSLSQPECRQRVAPPLDKPTRKAKGYAVGTNSWTATVIPLVSDITNAIIVTATTPSSWTPAYGGTTTFSKTLFVLSTPVRASLALQPPSAVLNWTGGVAPFQVQRASALSGVNWIEMVTNAVPPLLIPVDQATGFYRIVGQ
jgi:hypothetical protein